MKNVESLVSGDILRQLKSLTLGFIAFNIAVKKELVLFQMTMGNSMVIEMLGSFLKFLRINLN
ncbi:hypothetical protein A8M45_28735 [Escherichia coli]|nr:hypothetical protein A8G02_29340 [Escherichia coli]OWE24214.1 hypothetical protein A8M45_28735 [Escherichia coli]